MENTRKCPFENEGFYLVIIVKPRSPVILRLSGFFCFCGSTMALKFKYLHLFCVFLLHIIEFTLSGLEPYRSIFEPREIPSLCRSSSLTICSDTNVHRFCQPFRVCRLFYRLWHRNGTRIRPTMKRGSAAGRALLFFVHRTFRKYSLTLY